MEINPVEINGNWAHGWALDLHTISSVPVGYNFFGHLEFDTTRSEIGEAIYQLKYRNDKSKIDPVAQAVADFIKSKHELNDVCAIIAASPSDTSRSFQPVVEIAKIVGARLNISVPEDYLQKIKQTPVLKNETDSQKRHEALEGVFKIIDARYSDKHILVFDDLFRSGETLKAICGTLSAQGKVGKISVVTATYTRSRK